MKMFSKNIMFVLLIFDDYGGGLFFWREEWETKMKFPVFQACFGNKRRNHKVY